MNTKPQKQVYRINSMTTINLIKMKMFHKWDIR